MFSYCAFTDDFVSVLWQAIKWALEQKVDIISMSWTTRTSDKHLERAVYEAADDSSGRATLMFCSTADEGMYSDNIYPADYDKKVVRVSATDRWGHLTSKSHGPKAVNIQIPGENIEAVGPAYIGSVMPHVSGSSVATALAAGIASLALLLLRTYNNADDRTMRRFYTKEGIMRVFNQMDADKGGIQLSKLFPLNMDKESTVHDTLQRNWSIENFPE